MPHSKLVITKSLGSNYVSPELISHRVLADRIAARDPGHAPRTGDRIAYAHIVSSKKRMGDRIETVDFIQTNGLRIDYNYYITNQIMNPVTQLLALVLEKLHDFPSIRTKYESDLYRIYETYHDIETCVRKQNELRAKKVKALLFDQTISRNVNKSKGQSEMTSFFQKK